MERNCSIFTIIIFFIPCMIYPFILATAANNITTDQDALHALKAHITDDPTNFLAKNWNTITSVCNWIGVTCDNIQHRITALNISGLNLGGSIPLQLRNLSSLQTLDLSHNWLVGTIPSSIFGMSSLQTLDLSYNNLSGELPANICNSFSYLKFLYLKGNMFYGKIPSTLSKCKQLQHLFLSHNHFSGVIPKEIGNLTKLRDLRVGYNTLQGEIPKELGYLVELQCLSLANNLLTGTIPLSIFNLSSISDGLVFSSNNLSGGFPSDICYRLPFLQGLYMDQNQFTGPIPQMGECRKLVNIALSYNQFTGQIPKDVGNLTSIKEIDLGHNNLICKIPKELGYLVELQWLSLTNNFLIGTIPLSIFNLSSISYVMDFSSNNLTGGFPNDMCHHLPFLQKLYMHSNLFTGPIPQLGQCQKLVHISLSYNQFTGRIPRDIGNLTSAKNIYLNYNNLIGEIPKELGYLVELEFLSLGSNLLTGTIPLSIFNLSSISYGIDFSSNNLTGGFPNDMCHRLPFLQGLYMHYNRFTGPISQLGQCRKLVVISLAYNQFTGQIPRDIGNLTLVEIIHISNNSLIGEIPKELGYLPFLQQLHLGYNQFTGPIPRDIGNLTSVKYIYLGFNNLIGTIPHTFGNLRNLERLYLHNNYLTSSTPELSFLSSLSNCKNLKRIYLSGNPLNAILPSSIGNLSINLEVIDMGDCNISGSIPEEIGNLINLTELSLEGNKLNGSIPISIGRLLRLQALYLGTNKLEGSIPDDLCHLPALFELYLEANKLSGSIPACLGNLSPLRELSLSYNELTSNIPSTFWNLKDILHVSLSSNSLTGPLPLEIGNLKVVIKMDLSKNLFSGDIPTTVTGLKDLQFLSLGYNGLTGSIPDSFGDLISLESLDLSNNNLSGVIPKSMAKLLYLKYLNLSFNKLEGEIPSGGPFANFSAESFIGNDLLCGSSNFQVPPCKNSKHSTFVVLGIVLPLSTAIILVLVFVLKSGCRERNTGSRNDANVSPQGTQRRFSHTELLRAANGFSECNLIGMGSFGSVYKAKFQDGMDVAVKVFHLQFEGAFSSFDTECEVMKRIRHRNLVKIISSCSNDDFKALVLEYMPNGSLENCLYSSSYSLDIFQRLNIMIDVASALEYLHFGYSIPVIHCDIKPSNVLLDENMVAHLSDFGIAKLLRGEDQSLTRTQTLATIGYMAPEYGREGKISTKGDVYSYGIMLMETFTRKKPTDVHFAGEMSLKSWVNDFLHSSVMELVDTNLLSREDKYFAAKEHCVSSILNLAIECTTESPKERISTQKIAPRLFKIRDTLLRNV